MYHIYFPQSTESMLNKIADRQGVSLQKVIEKALLLYGAIHNEKPKDVDLIINNGNEQRVVSFSGGGGS